MPAAQAQAAETMADIHRTAAGKGKRPSKKLAATADILRLILAPIDDDLVGLRDRTLLLVDFAESHEPRNAALEPDPGELPVPYQLYWHNMPI